MDEFRIADGYSISTQGLFENLNYKVLDMGLYGEGCYRHAYCRHMAMRIFAYSFYLVLQDMIENNTFFIPPSKGISSEIKMRRIEGQEFKNYMRKGSFSYIDFVWTGFRTYRPYLYVYNKTKDPTENVIYMFGELGHRFVQLQNRGKQYF